MADRFSPHPGAFPGAGRRPVRHRLGPGRSAAVAGVGALAAFSLGGLGVLLVWLSLVTVVFAVAALLAVPGAPPPPPTPARAADLANVPYRSYRQVAERLSWAGVSPRHYDLSARPLLQRLLASRLAERHGIDLHRSPDAARALVGDDLWHWLDPARRVDQDSDPPGLDQGMLNRIVERLESL